MCVDVDDPVTVLTDRLRKARKPHDCYECQRTIAPGETYRYETFISEGVMDSLKTCAHCDQARRWNTAVCHGSYYFGMLLEDVVEHWTEGEVLHALSFGRLVVGCRDKWNGGSDALLPEHVLVEAITSCGGTERTR